MGSDQLLNIRWAKRGLLIGPPFLHDWAQSHAMLPCVEPVGGNRFRLYYGSRDADNRSHVARAHLVAEGQTLSVEHVESEPVLGPGELGAFDQDGVTPACLVIDGDRRWLYYGGWCRAETVPFLTYVGLAVSDDGGQTFQRVSRAPILERTDLDPFLTGSPAVLREGQQWRMWYSSGTRWIREDGEAKHYYHIRYAESADGVAWDRRGDVCIDFEEPDEYAIAKPCVRRVDGGYAMWYCYRGDVYRLGYAESHDGVKWQRSDQNAGLNPSDSGWDSEMIAYPWVFQHAGVLFMLYNGNGYGRSGIGYAVADAPGFPSED